MRESPRLKICVVGLRGVPGVMGGIESHCEQIFPRLAELAGDCDITIIGRRPYLPKGAFSYRGIRVVPLPAARNKFLEAITSTTLGVLHARFVQKADIIHIHGIGPALLSPLARLLGMKVVVTHHGQDFEREKWNGFAKAVLRLGEQCALRSANRMIVVSKSVTESLRSSHPRRRERIEHIPNGAIAAMPAAAEGDDAAVLAELGLQPGSYILAVGRLVPEKGFHFLTEAFRLALPGLPAAMKLAIAGKADHADRYSRGLLEQASARISFLGFQRQDILRVLYRHAALFVLPSTHEGLPIVALEAGAHGAPMLLSDIQPNLDIGLPAHHYFASARVDALAAKLTQDHATFRVDAADIGRRFDWGAVTAATRRVYATLAAA